VIVATRSEVGRIVLDVERVPDPGGEAQIRDGLLSSPCLQCPRRPRRLL
jgi:hypothetical protein